MVVAVAMMRHVTDLARWVRRLVGAWGSRCVAIMFWLWRWAEVGLGSGSVAVVGRLLHR